MSLNELPSEQLRRRFLATDGQADVAAGATSRVMDGDDLAQPRALEAIDFGMNMDAPGYNVFALGEVQTGMHDVVLDRLGELAATKPPSQDLCYVANFDNTAQPKVIELPAGLGRRVRDDVDHLLNSLTAMISSTFNSEEFREQITEVLSQLRARQTKDTQELQAEALKRDLVMLQTPNGFVFAPQRDGEVLEAANFDALDKEAREKISTAIEEMTEKLRERLQAYPGHQQELVKQQRHIAEAAVKQVLGSLTRKFRAQYRSHEAVIGHIDAISKHMIDNIDRLLALGSNDSTAQPGMTPEQLRDYQVNLLVDRSDERCAPVIYESNPSLENLVGKLEHRIELGVPVTDFSLIRPGALHRANGGYLVLDAERILNKPFTWEALKRALSDGCLRIESVSQLLSMAYSISLDPEPVSLDVKIVLLGARRLYHLLRHYDSDFDSLFKVLADFADEITWNADNEAAYRQTIREFSKTAGLRTLDDSAIGSIVEHGSRLVADRKRLSAHTQELYDLVREANRYALEAGDSIITQEHVDTAVAKRLYRVDRVKELVLQNIERGVTVVETKGARVGQINGLSVMQLGKLVFGQPSRITATARLGRGEVMDIERESKLGGKIHSKAVMIVSNFIGYRYAKEQPLSLHASLVFEQSYGGIEGDSASIAEVCALLSAVVDLPLRQDVAVTGSMDQHGAVQAIGGVNEKIEGFFEVCTAYELTGTQGVLIPASNVDNLMLKDDVVRAVAAGTFHIYTMSNVDDAMALLFGRPNEPASVPDIDSRIQSKLKKLYGLWRQAQEKLPGVGADDNGN